MEGFEAHQGRLVARPCHRVRRLIVANIDARGAHPHLVAAQERPGDRHFIDPLFIPVGGVIDGVVAVDRRPHARRRTGALGHQFDMNGADVEVDDVSLRLDVDIADIHFEVEVLVIGSGAKLGVRVDAAAGVLERG